MAKEYFPFTGKIPFEGKDSKNVMAFHYYEPERVVMGKKVDRRVEAENGNDTGTVESREKAYTAYY